jgi:ribonuclease J
LLKPKYFIPAFGEGRHIIHHAKLAAEWGLSQDNIFPLQNGQIFSMTDYSASLIGRVDYQAVLVNREHGERITTFTVNERRAMSLEGLITISLIIDSNYNLISGPQFDCSAASFRYSIQWKDACVEMTKSIVEALEKQAFEKAHDQEKTDQVEIRSIVRDAAFKTLRSHLQTKPVLQIVVQQLNSRQIAL